MPNSILHKRSSTAGVVPHAALLANGEIALNSADGTWFIKKTDGTILDLRQPLIADGGAQPLAGLNADAQDWQTRVIAAGGTVSASTFTAVNNFCNAITAAGIRDRFYRLNLFCGNDLTACRVPLYRGPSLTGTQFGGVTDTMNAGDNFVAGDYFETGAGAGLRRTALNNRKYLNTGFSLDSLPSIATGHLSIYRGVGAVSNKQAIGAAFVDGTHFFEIGKRGDGSHYGCWGSSSFTGYTAAESNHEGSALIVVTRTGPTMLELWNNTSLVATQTTNVTPVTPAARPVFVFLSNRYDSNATSVFEYWEGTVPLQAYSIGLSLTSAQISAYHAAMRAFQSDLNRAPPILSNADAQDWINRVYTAGGSVSTATAAAVNNFCNAINAAGIRDRFYRLNLFCGNNFTACLVPLYRGQSLGGTQFGSATDGNNNFVSGDYAETGASGGLLGNGTNKFLTTGVVGNQVPFGNLHLSAYVCTPSISGILRTAVSSRSTAGDALPNASATLTHNGNPATTGGRFIEDATTGAAQATTSNAAGLILGTSVSTTDRRYFVNGRQDGVTETSALTQTTYPTVRQFCVYTSLVDTNYSDARLGAYSIGVGMTSTQVAAYYRVMTAFQTALARRPAVPNADAQDWVNRVYTAGGTVSQSTADAVNTFCTTINSTGLRDRFYRLNLFCGNNLAACLVPLYRGQSLGGTQFGNTTDTNNNFTASDYNERGTTGGLIGNGSNKSLNTGIAGTTLLAGDRHLASYEIVNATSAYSPSLGAYNADTFANMHVMGPWTVATNYVYRTHNTVAGNAGQVNKSVGFYVGSDTSSTASVLYLNGQVVSSVSGQPAGGSSSSSYTIFATTGESSEARIGGYSIGLSMTAAQALVYNNAVQAFQTALNRAV